MGEASGSTTQPLFLDSQSAFVFRLQTLVEDGRLKLTSLREELVEISGKRKEAESQSERLKSTLVKKEANGEELKSRVAQLKELVGTLTSSEAALQLSCEKLEVENRDMSNDVGVLERKVADLEGTVRSLRDSNVQLEIEVNTARDKLTSFEVSSDGVYVTSNLLLDGAR